MLSTGAIAARLKVAAERRQQQQQHQHKLQQLPSGAAAPPAAAPPPPDWAQDSPERTPKVGSKRSREPESDGPQSPSVPPLGDEEREAEESESEEENIQPSYTDRRQVPPHTTTHNRLGLRHDIRACRRVEIFRKLNLISEGTFGKVWRACDRDTHKVMALKQVKMEKEKEGFPITALREIDVLMNLSHENIVQVTEIVVGDCLDSIFLVMEYVEHDLRFLTETLKHRWSLSEAKCLTQQLLRAVAFMHRNWVLHRDLKTSNLLYNNHGVLKVCDFGLARLVGQSPQLTPGTCTLWYRSPEVLLGSRTYTDASDCWAVGAIAAEFVSCTPLLPARTEVDLLDMICRRLGCPDKESWPGFYELPDVAKGKVKLAAPQPSRLAQLFCTLEGVKEEAGGDANSQGARSAELQGRASPPPPPDLAGQARPTSSNSPSPPERRQQRVKPFLTEEGVRFLQSLLELNPARRSSAAQALRHPFLAEAPLPQEPPLMPTFPQTNDRPRKVIKQQLGAR